MKKLIFIVLAVMTALKSTRSNSTIMDMNTNMISMRKTVRF